VSAEAYGPHTEHYQAEAADFCLTPEELSKGEQAAETYLGSMKPGEQRRGAEEALDTLAAVISGGVCGGNRFPWHQVRAYHGALAISIVKERGAPGQIEALRCRHDDTRKYQQVPETYKPKEVQRMRTSLQGVIEECWNLGFISDEDMQRAVRPPKRNGATKSARERELTDGEVRALLSACAMDGTIAGSRDALMIGLAWHGGLKTVDLINLTLDDLQFDQKTGCAMIRHKAPGAKRARRIPLANDDLIALEDWLETRAREPGPLFCPMNRGHIDRRRLSAAQVRELCEHRATQAGVLPFAPNDIARSSPFGASQSKRRRTRADESLEGGSPLWDGAASDQNEDDAARISFPYRVRASR
jgi:integrase